MPALVEHLRARLGANAVYGLRCIGEHRPENAQVVAEPMLVPELKPKTIAPDAVHAPFRRPAWLLSTPRELDAYCGRPRYGGALILLDGPERIESGWWDGVDIERDYYVARDTHGAHLWIYRECEPRRRWFLHGIFG
jgi:protein ImuB